MTGDGKTSNDSEFSGDLSDEIGKRLAEFPL